MFLWCIVPHQIRYVPAQEEWASVSLLSDFPDQRCCFIGEQSSIESLFMHHFRQIQFFLTTKDY